LIDVHSSDFFVTLIFCTSRISDKKIFVNSKKILSPPKYFQQFSNIFSHIFTGPKYVSRRSLSIGVIEFLSIFPIFPSKLRKISLKTTPSKSTQPEQKELEGWFQRRSTRISKRNNIARYTRPRISKISPTGSELPLDSKSTQPQRNEIEACFQRRSTRILKCNNVVSDTEPLGPTVREIQSSKHVISGTEGDRKKIPMDERRSRPVLHESVIKKLSKIQKKFQVPRNIFNNF